MATETKNIRTGEDAKEEPLDRTAALKKWARENPPKRWEPVAMERQVRK